MEESPKYSIQCLKSNTSYLKCFVVAFLLYAVLLVGCGDSPEVAPDFSGLNIDQLVSHFQSGNSVEKLEVCRCLTLFNDNDSVKELMAALSDEDKMVKVAAITGLASIGSNVAIDSLLPFLTEDDPMLSFNAMNALIEIGGKEAITEILKTTANNEKLSSDFKDLVQSKDDTTDLSKNLFEITADFKVQKIIRMKSLDLLNFVKFNKGQIVSLFKISKKEKDKEISSAMAKVAKMQKESFLLREKQQRDDEDSQHQNEMASGDSKQTHVEKITGIDGKIKAEKAAKAVRQTQARRDAEAARQTQARRDAEAARQTQAISQLYDWPNPQSVLSGFISQARKGMSSAGNRSAGIRHYNLGVEESAVGNKRGAIESYARAVQAYPEFFEAHFALAMLYDGNRNLEKGLFHLSQCLLLEPERDDVCYRIACNYEAQRNEKYAWAFFIIASQKNRGSSEYLFRAGLIAFRKKDLKKAIVLMKKASAISPRRSDILENLAALHLNLGQKQKAREYAIQARSYGANVDALLEALKP